MRDSGKLALLPGEVKAAQLRERELTLADTLMSLPQVRSARDSSSAVHLAWLWCGAGKVINVIL